MDFVVNSPEEIARLYRELSLFPSLSRADVGPVITSQYGGKYCNIYTEWNQRDLERNENVKFCRQYIVFHDDTSVVYSGASGNCTEIKGEVLSKDSPSGEMKAVVRDWKKQDKENQFLEIWRKNIKVKSIDLKELKKHGKVYDDDQFGCLLWSKSETHLLYVAERKRPKAESFFEVLSLFCFCFFKGEQFAYYEDWGEEMDGKSCPVLCVLDIEGDNVSVLEGVPEDISPGQAFWAPGDTGVVFVGWWHEPFRLGLMYSPTRRSSLFYVDLTHGNCEQLISDSKIAVFSPRLSPDQRRIIYLQCSVSGPLMQCSKLSMYDWYTKTTSVVVDVVQCWSADSQRVVLTTPQRCRKGDTGTWVLLNIERDLMVVNYSSLNRPPTLRIGFLPARDSEEEVAWVTLEDSQPLPEISWEILTFTPPPEQENKDYPGLKFEAFLLKPKEVQEGVKLPLIVSPHGGPHLLYMSEWILSAAFLCKIGFGLLMVNYRGSRGYGQDYLLSVIGRIGDQDVKDVQFAVESVLKSGEFDAEKVAVMGGSHGAFLVCHLIGQYPGFYRFYSAGVARNPVTNMATMVSSTDIPDWCMVESGYDYSADWLPDPEVWSQMLEKSPIKYVEQVQTPLLLLLGKNDKRVPNNQGMEFYRALKVRQRPVRMLMYTGHNHSLLSIDTESDRYMNLVLWIIQHLSLGSRHGCAEQK
uniref:acylaminoacyl-peptidase n=1 Tax=Cynoglossus semilaevis TaxID=244447 RepID=A0A3P8UQU2_CYNSE